MKKFLIGSLVGAILVFGWQTVAHMFMHHHDDAYKQMPNDKAVLQTLSGATLAEGQYFIPNVNMNASPEEQQRMNESMVGKPWAIITYHPAYDMNMGMSAFRGFFTVLLSVLLFIFIMGKNPGSFSTIFLKGLAIGFFTFIFVWYNQNIWMGTPWSAIKGELIDHLVEWGLCGIWLGWWLNRINKNSRSAYTTVN